MRNAADLSGRLSRLFTHRPFCLTVSDS